MVTPLIHSILLLCYRPMDYFALGRLKQQIHWVCILAYKQLKRDKIQFAAFRFASQF
ncbi:hypothetical protein CPS_0192 [Colwellia psychrerythraea 34H]|uniref:Uncharacterized protein n=1 Tax=Colwellia psychrerythraea (strain 34H / ATCC BAA-681) TaxID=167879 RepID=Q48AF3_COLP3|nr:hypothetical protein CPS_0192 [Colwellia psychrerythraea 34H]